MFCLINTILCSHIAGSGVKLQAELNGVICPAAGESRCGKAEGAARSQQGRATCELGEA